MFERTHLPERCAGPKGSTPAAVTPGSCVTGDALNPLVLRQRFRDYQDAGPFPRPPLAPRNQWFRYQGFPYVTGQGFMKLADFEYETDNWLFGRRHIHFNASRLENRSLVYWHLEGKDLRTLRKRIPELGCHIFVICNSVDDPEFPDWLLNNPYILKVFSVNIPAAKSLHPKLVPLPLGIRFTASEAVQEGRAMKRDHPPGGLLLASFSIGKGTPRADRRRRVLQAVAAEFHFSPPEVEQRNPNYTESVLRHKFILAPPGLGLDTYRAWQALYLGRVPVIGPELPSSLYDGLPVLQVSDWATLTPSTLAAAWANLTHRTYTPEKLTIHWWVRLILRTCLLTP